MFEHIVPTKSVGFLAPRLAVDTAPYEFYQFAPKGLMMVTVPMGIQKFTEGDVERVFGDVDTHLQELVERKVDLIFQAGVPLMALAGPEVHDRRLAYIADKTGIPVTSALLAAVDACRHLGIRKLALGNKFTTAINERLGAFFTREGIEIAGVYAWEKQRDNIDPNAIIRMSGTELMEVAYEVGREAFHAYPDCDGLYMAGGTWPVTPVAKDLEAEFGKPVIGHKDLTIWQASRLVGMWEPRPGLGRLLSGT